MSGKLDFITKPTKYINKRAVIGNNRVDLADRRVKTGKYSYKRKTPGAKSLALWLMYWYFL